MVFFFRTYSSETIVSCPCRRPFSPRHRQSISGARCAQVLALHVDAAVASDEQFASLGGVAFLEDAHLEGPPVSDVRARLAAERDYARLVSAIFMTSRRPPRPNTT